MNDPEKWVGKRFVTDLRVVSIEPRMADDGTRVAVVHMQGDRVELSVGELSAMIDAGFLVEVPERR